MSINGDASEQVVRLGLEGFEMVVKLTGSGAKNIAAMLYATLNNQNQTKGKARLNTMLKTGKPLKIFAVKQEDLKTFSEKAKRYGIMYSALMDKDTDGIVDILVKEEDASRINRIVERFKITTVDTVKVTTEKTRNNDSKEIHEENENTENFKLAKTEKSPLLEHSSMISEMQDGVSKNDEKISVRKELAKMKVEANKKYNERIKAKDNSKVTNLDDFIKNLMDVPSKKYKKKGKNVLE